MVRMTHYLLLAFSFAFSKRGLISLQFSMPFKVNQTQYKTTNSLNLIAPFQIQSNQDVEPKVCVASRNSFGARRVNITQIPKQPVTLQFTIRLQ